MGGGIRYFFFLKFLDLGRRRWVGARGRLKKLRLGRPAPGAGLLLSSAGGTAALRVPAGAAEGPARPGAEGLARHRVNSDGGGGGAGSATTPCLTSHNTTPVFTASQNDHYPPPPLTC